MRRRLRIPMRGRSKIGLTGHPPFVSQTQKILRFSLTLLGSAFVRRQVITWKELIGPAGQGRKAYCHYRKRSCDVDYSRTAL